MTSDKKFTGLIFAALAAFLFALNIPVSKHLLSETAPAILASLLYLGAGMGIALVGLISKSLEISTDEKPLSKADMTFVAGMVALDVAAPILMMLGLRLSSAAEASLLGSFEAAATSVVALVVFRERVSPLLWFSISLVSAASALLSFEGTSHSVSIGSLFMLAACICWGFENNMTRKLSSKNPLHIVVVKGIFSGIGSLFVAVLSGEAFPPPATALFALLIGFVSYGLSIFFYVRAQRELGAARTSAVYALAPFIGAAISLLLFGSETSPLFAAALALMLLGTALNILDLVKK